MFVYAFPVIVVSTNVGGNNFPVAGISFAVWLGSGLVYVWGALACGSGGRSQTPKLCSPTLKTQQRALYQIAGPCSNGHGPHVPTTTFVGALSVLRPCDLVSLSVPQSASVSKSVHARLSRSAPVSAPACSRARKVHTPMSASCPCPHPFP